jgi:hypothetical protein
MIRHVLKALAGDWDCPCLSGANGTIPDVTAGTYRTSDGCRPEERWIRDRDWEFACSPALRCGRLTQSDSLCGSAENFPEKDKKGIAVYCAKQYYSAQ